MSPGLDPRQLSELLFRACHDLRSSVRAIRTQTELMQRRGAAANAGETADGLASIVQEAGRLDLLVEGLARYSIALETDRNAFQPVAMDVLLRTVLRKLSTELRSHDAQVTSDPLPRVWGNPDRLMEALEILLRNALAHRGAAAPRVTVTVNEQEDGWLFAVRDNGRGVATQFLESIFKPFSRLEGKKKDGPGLGLTIAKAIIERMSKMGIRVNTPMPAGLGRSGEAPTHAPMGSNPPSSEEAPADR